MRSKSLTGMMKKGKLSAFTISREKSIALIFPTRVAGLLHVAQTDIAERTL